MEKQNATSLFQELEIAAFRGGIKPRSEESRKWFRNKVKELGQINRQHLLRDQALTKKNRFLAGRMMMFFYDPKHRDTLPFYDAFPLVIMLEPAPGGFYGLNLHYLSPMVRARFLDKLLETTNNKRYDESTRFRLTYQLLKSVRKYKEFQPCFKHYLRKQVDSNIVMVEPPEWEIAIFLPTEQFRKKNKTHVWGNSKRQFS
jgi:hypothetical protein